MQLKTFIIAFILFNSLTFSQANAQNLTHLIKRPVHVDALSHTWDEKITYHLPPWFEGQTESGGIVAYFEVKDTEGVIDYDLSGLLWKPHGEAIWQAELGGMGAQITGVITQIGVRDDDLDGYPSLYVMTQAEDGYIEEIEVSTSEVAMAEFPPPAPLVFGAIVNAIPAWNQEYNPNYALWQVNVYPADAAAQVTRIDVWVRGDDGVEELAFSRGVNPDDIAQGWVLVGHTFTYAPPPNVAWCNATKKNWQARVHGQPATGWMYFRPQC